MHTKLVFPTETPAIPIRETPQLSSLIHQQHVQPQSYHIDQSINPATVVIEVEEAPLPEAHVTIPLPSEPTKKSATTKPPASTATTKPPASTATTKAKDAPTSTAKKRVEIIGDSMLGGIWNWSRENHVVKIHEYGGATSEDMNDMVQIALRRNPAALIIHSGTNDFEQKMNTKNELKKVITSVRSSNENIKIAISALCYREDKPELIPKIKDMNNQLKILCSQHQVHFIDNKNFDRKCLASKKLHPNDHGNSVLAHNFKRCIASLGFN